MEENLWKISLSGNLKKSGLDVLCSKLLICTEKKNKTNKRNIVFLTVYFAFLQIYKQCQC